MKALSSIGKDNFLFRDSLIKTLTYLCSLKKMFEEECEKNLGSRNLGILLTVKMEINEHMLHAPEKRVILDIL